MGIVADLMLITDALPKCMTTRALRNSTKCAKLCNAWTPPMFRIRAVHPLTATLLLNQGSPLVAATLGQHAGDLGVYYAAAAIYIDISDSGAVLTVPARTLQMKYAQTQRSNIQEGRFCVYATAITTMPKRAEATTMCNSGGWGQPI